MAENLNNMPQEDEGIDIMALVRSLWDGKKTIIIWTCVFMVIGLISALSMKRIYQVSTMMVPQTTSKTGSSLSSLASLAGIDLSSTQTADLSPLVYPSIVSSVPFQLELMYTPLHYEKVDTAVSMIAYAKNYSKPSFFSNVKKYTIGLPSLLKNKMRKTIPEIEMLTSTTEEDIKPVIVSKEEDEMLKVMGKLVSLIADKKEGTLILTVKGSEPIQTAELALKAQQLLQNEITRFRTEKAQNELDYIQARYDEMKAEAESYQYALASITDRSQNTIGSKNEIERARIQAKYSLANSLYTEMAKQLETAKMQVKKDTPTFTIIQPVKVPTQASNSRAKEMIIWTLFGFILGCCIVMGKNFFAKFKEMFAKS